MKKLLFLFSLLFASSAYSQQSALIGVECAPLKALLKGLQSKEYNEVPGWIGASELEGVYYTVFYNKSTLAWTLIRYEKEIGCILGFGTPSHFYNNNETTKNFPMHSH